MSGINTAVRVAEEKYNGCTIGEMLFHTNNTCQLRQSVRDLLGVYCDYPFDVGLMNMSLDTINHIMTMKAMITNADIADFIIENEGEVFTPHLICAIKGGGFGEVIRMIMYHIHYVPTNHKLMIAYGIVNDIYFNLVTYGNGFLPRDVYQRLCDGAGIPLSVQIYHRYINRCVFGIGEMQYLIRFVCGNIVSGSNVLNARHAVIITNSLAMMPGIVVRDIYATVVSYANRFDDIDDTTAILMQYDQHVDRRKGLIHIDYIDGVTDVDYAVRVIADALTISVVLDDDSDLKIMLRFYIKYHTGWDDVLTMLIAIAIESGSVQSNLGV